MDSYGTFFKDRYYFCFSQYAKRIMWNTICEKKDCIDQSDRKSTTFARSFNKSRLDNSITLSTKRNLARTELAGSQKVKCRYFYCMPSRLLELACRKKALKEWSDSRLLLIKHPPVADSRYAKGGEQYYPAHTRNPVDDGSPGFLLAFNLLNALPGDIISVWSFQIRISTVYHIQVFSLFSWKLLPVFKVGEVVVIHSHSWFNFVRNSSFWCIYN